MTNRISAFPGHNDPAPLHRHGGRILAQAELPISYLGDDYVVEGSGSIRALPAMPAGLTVELRILGAPTFVNSSKLLCQGNTNYVAAPGDLAIARSDGDGAWRVYVLSSAIPVSSVNGQTGALAFVPAPQVRLSLSSGVAVPTSDFTGQTSIYATPVSGNQAPIFDGSQFVPRSFTEQILALDPTSGHTNYHQSGKNYDGFLYWTGSAVGFGTGPAWNAGAVAGSDILRGTGAGSTEIQWINGIPTNKNSITLRTGANSGDTVVIAANQATCIGSFRTTSDGQATDSKTRRLVSNAFNAVDRILNEVAEPTYSWTYTAATWHVANANAATKAEILNCFDGNPVRLRLKCASNTDAGTLPIVSIGIGVDGSAPNLSAQSPYIAGSGWYNLAFCFYDGYPGLGFHSFAPYEKAAGSNTQGFVGETVPRMIGTVWA